MRLVRSCSDQRRRYTGTARPAQATNLTRALTCCGKAELPDRLHGDGCHQASRTAAESGAPVIVVKDDTEAVAVANDIDYGLAAIQTGSRERGRAMADQLETGIVHVNDPTLNNDAYAPFGGTGASGNGARFGSQSSWDEFTQWRWVTIRDQAHGFPF